MRLTDLATKLADLAQAIQATADRLTVDPSDAQLDGLLFTLAMRRYVNQPTVAFPWDR